VLRSLHVAPLVHEHLQVAIVAAVADGDKARHHVHVPLLGAVRHAWPNGRGVAAVLPCRACSRRLSVGIAPRAWLHAWLESCFWTTARSCVDDGPRVSPSRRRQAPEQEPRASQRSLTRGWWGRVGRAQIAIVNSNAECAHLGFAGVFEAKEWSARGLREHRFHTITFSHPDVGLAAGENARGGGHGW
jgi:hypothetical protein